MNYSKAFWDNNYNNGQENLYPWDYIVSFVYKNKPAVKNSDVSVLEVGCGTACNLWFCAREGFNVSGIDFSYSAIDKCIKRFDDEGLKGDFKQGDFTALPWSKDEFDLVLDRGALTCASFMDMEKALREIYRVLKPGGRFIFSPCSVLHSSSVLGTYEKETRLVKDITGGTLKGVKQVCFLDEKDIIDLFDLGWLILDIELLTKEKCQNDIKSIHAEYHVTLEKKF